MKYQSTLLYLVLLGLSVSFSSQARHIYGGEIRAEAISCQSLTYKITVVIYTDTSSDVEFGNGILSLGFGDPIEVSPDRAFTFVTLTSDSTVAVNTYEREQTFPGPGTYLINFREFNRAAQIINVPNAVQTPFYTETKLVISPLACNSPPLLTDTLSPVAYAGSRYELPLRATDPDGDSLSVELVTPRDEAEREIRGYQLPINYDRGLLRNPVASDGNSEPTFIVSPEALVWDAPNLGGEFVVNVRVNEWRQLEGEWVALGYVTRDMIIQVVDTIGQPDIRDLLVTDTEEAFAKPEVYLYPNPTFGPLSLEVTKDTWQGATATLYNIIGEALDERRVVVGSNQYELTNFNNGFYFINLRQGELKKTLRFVKR